MIQILQKGETSHYPHTSTKRGQLSSFFRLSSFVARGTNRQKLPVGVISTTTRLGRYSCSLRDRFRSLSAPSSWRAAKGSKEAKCSCEAGSRSSREGWVSSSRPGTDPRSCGGGFEADMVVRARETKEEAADALIGVEGGLAKGVFEKLRSRGWSPFDRHLP